MPPQTQTVPVQIGVHTYQITSDDHLYLAQISPVFEPATVALFDTLRPGVEVVVDVGANLGCTVLYWAAHGVRVAAFEAAPSTCAFLRQNLQAAGCTTVTVHPVGLSDAPGTATLVYAPALRAGAAIATQVIPPPGLIQETITLTTLDTVVPTLVLPRLDVVKLDVEGWEGPVLRGAVQTLARFQPVVVLELNHWCLTVFQRTCVPDFLDQLTDLFPVLWAVDAPAALDLHDGAARYTVMYHHILHGRFGTLVGAWRPLPALEAAYPQRTWS